MIDMCSSSSRLFSSSSELDAGETFRKQSLSPFAGLERPHDSFGQPKAPKSGVAPAHLGVLPVSKTNVAPCASFTLPITSVHPKGERNGERDGDLGLSRTVHLPSLEDRTDAHGLSPGRCQKRWFAPATAIRTPLAAPAH